MLRISALIIKKLRGEITPDERSELDLYANQSEENRRLVEDYSRHKHVLEEIKLSDKLRSKRAWRKMKKGLPGKFVPIKRYLSLAAAALLLLFIGWFFWEKKPAGKQLVSKVDKRQAEPEINTLGTRKAESRNLRLPDGSSIWLSSASSVQYPGGFSGPERWLTLVEGEVHCEIAKDSSKPFWVHVGDMEVKVIGTKFDISAYKDDGAVRTTLIEGCVLVKAGKDSLYVNAGEQVIWRPGKKLKKIKVDNPAVRSKALKAGMFFWDKVSLGTVLNDIADWYGYKVVYTCDLPSDPYDINIPRSQPLGDVLEIIKSYNHVNFKIRDSTITVYR